MPTDGPRSRRGGEAPVRKEPRDGAGRPSGARRLRGAVYGRLLEECAPKDEHVEALSHLGVVEEAVVVGKLGSLDAERSRRVSEALAEEFGAKRLFAVPGFERGRSGRVSLSLPRKREHVLLPCFGPDGLLGGVEALEYDPEVGRLVDSDRTASLSGAGAHLYVFAAYSPRELEGFCEGPLGAILAAQEDVVLGAVGHFRRYFAEAGSRNGDAARAAPLSELEGVNFGGREIVYVPRIGPGEENARAHEASAACRFLVERQNGVARLAFPAAVEEGVGGEGADSGGEPPLSLSAWVLTLPEDERQEHLRELFPESPDRREPDPEDDEERRGNPDREEPAAGEREAVSLSPASVLGAVALMAVAAAAVDAMVGRVEAFGQHVGVGHGGRPMVEGGFVGDLRGLARSTTMEVLYALKGPVSVLVGVAAGAGRLRARARVRRLSEDLRRFEEGPWTAHLVGERGPSSGSSWEARPIGREALEGLAGGALAYVLLRLVLGVARSLYERLASTGLVGDSYGPVFEGSGLIALASAVACGLYVFARRADLRRRRARLVEGKIGP